MSSKRDEITLADFDLFGQEATFYINEEQKKKTRFGGIISILIGLLTTSFIIYCLIEVFSRSKLNFTTKVDKQQGIAYGLSSNELFFAVGLRDVPPANFSSYFSLALQITNQTRPSNNPSNPVSSSAVYPMIPCTLAQLNSSAYNLTHNFTAFGLSNYYCPNITAFPFEGSYLNTNFTFIDLILLPCDGTPSCKSKEEIAAFLSDQDSLTLDFFYTTGSVNLQNHSKPVEYYLEAHSWRLSPLVTAKHTEIFITPEIINSKNSYISSGSSDTIKAYSIQQQQIRDFDSNYKKSGDLYAKTFMKMTLKLSSVMNVYTRSYTTFLDIASRIGGIYAFLIATLGFIAVRFNRYEIKLEIARQIYEYKSGDPRDKGESPAERSNTQEERRPPSGGNQRQERAYSLQSIRSGEKYNDFMNKFSVLINKPIMKTSFRQFLQSLSNLVCGRRAIELPGSKKFALQQVEEMISSDLDVIQILRRIQELEKLKDLLLTRDQKIVLQYTPKPKFYQSKAERDRNHQSEMGKSQALLPVQLEFHSEKEFLLLYKAYQGLLTETDPAKIAQNEQLKAKLGEELLTIFLEFDAEIEKDPNLMDYLFKKDKTAVATRQTNMLKPTIFGMTLTEPLLDNDEEAQNTFLESNARSEVFIPPKKVNPSPETILPQRNDLPPIIIPNKDLNNSDQFLDDLNIENAASVIVKINQK